VFKSRGLTSTRYNVLRILRGAGRGGRTCGEIREHMVWAVPDVTRIVDGLVRAGLAVRGRETLDARVVRIRITARGLGLLRRLDPAVEALHLEQLGSMGEGALEELNDLLVRARRATGGIAGDHAEESG
jgi:DNA-binding MarR family transcriptional regulator